jgi:hypothetical protein
MKKEKIFDRIRNNPKAVRFEELKKVLTDVGFEERQPKGGSRASFIFLLTLSECILYFQATSFIYFGGLDRRSIYIIISL